MTLQRFRYLCHEYTHVVALCGIGAGLTLNRVLLSVSTMLALLNLILYGKYGMYWANLRKARFMLGVWLYVGLMLLSFLWSSDWGMAFKEARPKIVLLVMPLVFIAGMKLSRAALNAIRISFLSALLLTSVLNILFYMHVIGNRAYTDFRDISLFGSHIRYSLLIVIGIVIMCFQAYRVKSWRFPAILITAWFIVYLWISQALTGYIVLACAFLAILLWTAFQSRQARWRIASLALFIGILSSAAMAAIEVLSPTPHKLKYSELPVFNANGRQFYGVPESNVWINGYPVHALIVPDELERAWNSRSEIEYATGVSKNGYPVSTTIISYLASRNLTKDSLGISQLTREEIGHIEDGVASVSYLGSGIGPRLATLRDHLSVNTDPNGNTLLQRFEYWKASIHIIRDNWVVGVGMGDLRKSFSDYYEENRSVLKEEFRNISHNEFLFSWVAMGIFGLAVFVIWWVLYLRKCVIEKNLEALLFGVIFICSCLSEDTLGTQMGASLCAFFYGFYCHQLKHKAY